MVDGQTTVQYSNCWEPRLLYQEATGMILPFSYAFVFRQWEESTTTYLSSSPERFGLDEEEDPSREKVPDGESSNARFMKSF